MKKVLLMLMLATPFFAMSQDKAAPLTAPATQDKAASASTVDAIFGEIILAENPLGGTVIRLEFGKEGMGSIEDKELLATIGEARKMQFSNIPDALFYMNNLGYKFVTSYSISNNKTPETHMVLEKRMGKREGQRPNGATRPTERPGTGSKPEVNDKGASNEKTPAPAKDGKSGKK